MESRPLIVSPDYRYLHNLQLLCPRNMKDLWIESPARNPLQGKNGCGGLPGKCLETALRVMEAQPKQQPQIKVESPGIDSAFQRLAMKLQRRIQPARANRYIGAALKCRK